MEPYAKPPLSIQRAAVIERGDRPCRSVALVAGAGFGRSIRTDIDNAGLVTTGDRDGRRISDAAQHLGKKRRADRCENADREPRRAAPKHDELGPYGRDGVDASPPARRGPGPREHRVPTGRLSYHAHRAQKAAARGDVVPPRARVPQRGPTDDGGLGPPDRMRLALRLHPYRGWAPDRSGHREPTQAAFGDRPREPISRSISLSTVTDSHQLFANGWSYATYAFAITKDGRRRADRRDLGKLLDDDLRQQPLPGRGRCGGDAADGNRSPGTRD